MLSIIFFNSFLKILLINFSSLVPSALAIWLILSKIFLLILIFFTFTLLFHIIKKILYNIIISIITILFFFQRPKVVGLWENFYSKDGLFYNICIGKFNNYFQEPKFYFYLNLRVFLFQYKWGYWIVTNIGLLKSIILKFY